MLLLFIQSSKNKMLKILLKSKKLIGINILILLFLISLPSILLYGFKKSKSLLSVNDKLGLIDPRAEYPVYSSRKIANEIYRDSIKTSTRYRAFLGWTKEKFKSKHVNILGKYNTRYSLGQELNNSIWFFGGSTMWGTGVSDKSTIPSNYNKITGESVFNFGEGGYNSRNALNQFITLLGDGYSPSKVIFYDGYNDVEHGCRVENNAIPTHSRELIIDNALKNRNVGIRNISKQLLFRISKILIEPYMLLVNNNNLKYENLAKGYNCDKDFSKSKKIASHLVNNWYSAYLIAKSKDIDFYAVLHPTLFSAKAPFEFFTEEWKMRAKYLKPQFEILYPLILDAVKSKCIKDKSFCEVFQNGSQWISSDSLVFIDEVHLTNKGNMMIAKELQLILNN